MASQFGGEKNSGLVAVHEQILALPDFQSFLNNLKKGEHLPYGFQALFKREKESQPTLTEILRTRAEKLVALRVRTDELKFNFAHGQRYTARVFFEKLGEKEELWQSSKVAHSVEAGQHVSLSSYLEFFSRFISVLERLIENQAYRTELEDAKKDFNFYRQKVDFQLDRATSALDGTAGALRTSLVVLTELLYSMNRREFRTFVMEEMGEGLSPIALEIEAMVFGEPSLSEKVYLKRWKLEDRSKPAKKRIDDVSVIESGGTAERVPISEMTPQGMEALLQRLIDEGVIDEFGQPVKHSHNTPNSLAARAKRLMGRRVQDASDNESDVTPKNLSVEE
jgi:hypothetical protein